MQQLEQTIMTKACGYRAVAFDVFGTLLVRSIGRPTDLFLLMEECGQAPRGFAAARVEAEKNARAKKTGEITIEDIYAEPILAEADFAAECAAELSVCGANEPVLLAARACHQRGQRIYAVSDMYLPKAQIRKMLQQCGYDFLEDVFVSSEYRVQKRSGKLFELFLSQTGLSHKEVLFVGDDFRADVMGAALAGIRSKKLPQVPALKYLPCPDDAAGRAAYALAQNAPRNMPHTEHLGYEVLGVLLCSFAQWIHRQKVQHNNAPIIFLARDMYLVKKIYRLLYPQDEAVHYLKVSRRSLIPALLQRPMNASALLLLADALPRQALTAAQILDYCGFAANQLPGYTSVEKFDFKARPLNVRTLDLLRAIAAYSKTVGGALVREQAELVRGYLGQQIGTLNGAVLVDIGTGGTTQRLLEELCGVRLFGCYLAGDARLHAHLPQARAAAFLFDGDTLPLHYWAGQPLLERMISEPCGATIAYRQRTDQLEPVTAPPQEDAICEELRSGALAFAQEWSKQFYAQVSIPSETAISAFLCLTENPSSRDAQILGEMDVEDGGVYPLARPQALLHYAAKPKQFRRDFAQARWKVAFLKRVFRLPLPYGRLYMALKRRQRG